MKEPICVPDAETWDEFESHARDEWYRRHPDKRGQQGRRYDKRIIEAIREMFLSYPPDKLPKQGRIIYFVKEKLKDDAEPPAEDTIRRYAKLFLLLKKAFENGGHFSPDQVRWLDNRMPSSNPAIDHIADTLIEIVPALKRLGQDINLLRSTGFCPDFTDT
jgi:hypothetical protein